jgi:hypothetical protein
VVTKFTRDVSSSTASQQVNFWLSLEMASEGIKAQLRSEELGIATRDAKRFHATISFIAETGLKDATDLGGTLLP